MKKSIASVFIGIQKICMLIAFVCFGFNQTASAQDSKGTEFWICFPGNLSSSDVQLYITGEQASSVTIQIPGIAFNQVVAVAAGGLQVVNLPATVQVQSSFTPDNKGIHITATTEVTVYGMNAQASTTDAFLAFPLDALGTDHYILGYNKDFSFDNPTQATVVATQPNTIVTITASVTGGGLTAGIPFNVTLQQGQVYQLRSNATNADYTGTRVVSDKPVSVFGGAQCTNISGTLRACDHLVEQLPPLSSWGRSFLTVPLATRTAGDVFRFLAQRNGTVVSVNGVVVANLNAGQIHERILGSTTYNRVTSNEPILVGQYSRSSQADNVTSDPFFALVPPDEQFLNSYTVSAGTANIPTNYINITSPTSNKATVRIDNTVVAAGLWNEIPGTTFSGAKVPVSVGVHRVTSTLPIGTLVYGFGSFDSYGYLGGQSFSPVAVVSEVTTVTTPPSGTSPVGISNCFTATVKDQFGNPLSGIRVDFTITGTNSGSSGFAFTAANGVATFCYSGPNPGTDQLVASVGPISSGPATFIWTPVNQTCIVSSRLYVDTSAVAGGNGASWACAFKQLYEAIEYANNVPSVSEIWIADGVYKPRNNGNRSEHFNLQRNGLRIVGGFSGNETTESQSNVVANPTILSGDLGTAGNPADNAYHLFILYNLRYSGQLLFKSLILQDGNASDVGGVAYAAYVPDLFYDSCIIQNNYAPTGGAFYLDNTAARYQFCIFQNNSANVGGVFFSFQSNVSFNRIFFLNNTAASFGGAYYGNLGSPVFKDVLFNRNTAGDGGAVYQNSMNATYLNCVLDSNTATGFGGGIYLHSGSTARLVNGTLYGNTAAATGGAVYAGINNPSLQAYNTIFWNNRRGNSNTITGSDIGFNNAGTPLTVQYSMLQTGTSVPADNGSTLTNNFRGVSPMFRSETNRTGPDGAWLTQDDGLQLTLPSAAVNSGDNTVVTSNGLIQDPTDYARIWCGTVDRGAYELQTCATPTFTTAEETRTIAEPIMAGAISAKEGVGATELRATGVVANPFSNELQVRYNGKEKASISVLNASGKVISTKANVSAGTYRFDATTWNKGLYIVTLTTTAKNNITLKAIRL